MFYENIINIIQILFSQNWDNWRKELFYFHEASENPKKYLKIKLLQAILKIFAALNNYMCHKQFSATSEIFVTELKNLTIFAALNESKCQK